MASRNLLPALYSSPTATKVRVRRHLPATRPLTAGFCVGVISLSAVASAPARAQDQDPMLFYDQGGLTVRGHLQFGLNAVAERNLFWDLAASTSAGSGFDPDTNWLEGYIKPGISFEYQLDAGAVVSVVRVFGTNGGLT